MSFDTRLILNRVLEANPNGRENRTDSHEACAVVNDGQFTDALEIEGQGIEEETDEIDGGATTELTVDLEAG